MISLSLCVCVCALRHVNLDDILFQFILCCCWASLASEPPSQGLQLRCHAVVQLRSPHCLGFKRLWLLDQQTQPL